MIAQWIIEYNEKYNHTLGYRRMCNYINRKHDKHYNKKRIHRLMELLGIKSEIRRSRHSCTKSKPCAAENILKRDNRDFHLDLGFFKTSCKVLIFISTIIII